MKGCLKLAKMKLQSKKTIFIEVGDLIKFEQLQFMFSNETINRCFDVAGYEDFEMKPEDPKANNLVDYWYMYAKCTKRIKYTISTHE